MSNTNYNILQHNDLTKRGGDRLQTFLDKVKTGKEFVTTKGNAIVDKKQYKLLESSMPSRGFSAILEAKVGSSKVELRYPNDFYKTPEFGGKGAGSGTAAEDRYLTSLRNSINKILQDTGLPFIRLKLANKRIVNCAGVGKTSRAGYRLDPKSDFSVLDEGGNEVGWLSHKAGSKASDFQQYGGLSDAAFSNNREVKKFMKDCIARYPKGLPSGVSLYRFVKDNNVIMMSVYGTDFGKKANPQNVDEFHQGDVKVTKSGLTYMLTSTHKGVNGDVPTGDYQCIYFARYTSDRGARVAGEFLPNARVGVFPYGKVANTSEII